MRRFIVPMSLILILLLFMPGEAFSATKWAQNEELVINSMTANHETVGQFERFEITIDLSATFDNPFDPEEIDLTAHFTSPSGKKIALPGFFFRDYGKTRRVRLPSKGPPQWKVRFAPLEIGEYKYYVVIRDKKGEVKSEESNFRVIESSNPGFLRQSKKAVHYLEFDSGKQYFGVGENIAWGSRENQIYDYDRYFSKMAENGCNYSRVWMVPWNLSLEWTNKGFPVGKFKGIGIYNLENAWRLDYILNLAKEKGIYFMLTMGNYSDLMVERGPWNEQMWTDNPYRKRNGGFCENPEEFFTNEKARSYYKKRLRYIIARWGYATNLLSFEFFNEYSVPLDWVKEMARFIKETDSSHHLVTSSTGYPWGDYYPEDKLWNLEDIDYTQTHVYGYKGEPIDLVGKLNSKIVTKVTSYPKPCLVAEFGIDGSKDNRFYDKRGKGVSLHNGLWAAVFSGSFAGAANWWWDSYVHPKKLYYHYQALANFVTTVDWTKGDWEIAKTTQPEKSLKPDEKDSYSDLVLYCHGQWAEMDGKQILIKNNGKLTGGEINRYLQAPAKKDIRLTPVFTVNYPKAGKFILHIAKVSLEANLHIYIDGKEVWQKEFPTGPEGKGEWKRSRWQKQWKRWFSTYDQEYTIDVPQGEHKIKLENTGKDWAEIKKITLTNYTRSTDYTDARIIGLSRQDEVLLWIQNIESNWYTNSLKKAPEPQEDFYFNVLDLPEGTYTLEWWDTWEGKITNQTEAVVTGGKLPIEISELTTDIAVKISKSTKR